MWWIQFLLDQTFNLIIFVFIATIFFLFLVKRSPEASPYHLFTGSFSFFYGLVSTIMYLVHIVVIFTLGVKNYRAGKDFYNFNFYSLILFGVVSLIPSLCCLVSSKSLAQGNPESWKKTHLSLFIIFIVNAPVIPLQKFALPLSLGAFCNLILLRINRTQYFQAQS